MQPAEFKALVATEAPLEITRPQFARAELPNAPLMLNHYLHQLQPTGKLKKTVYRHVLGPPASPGAVLEWQKKWPEHRLPKDIVELLTHFDGVHLWADESGRSYEGLASLEEWQPALFAMYGADAEPALLPESYLALSYHADGAAYIVLDARTQEYFLIDTAGPDQTCRIGTTTSELLDWLWANRIQPTSRRVPS